MPIIFHIVIYFNIMEVRKDIIQNVNTGYSEEAFLIAFMHFHYLD